MKTISISKLILANFKGIESLEVNLNSQGITVISGDNRKGKTTIMDAYLWLIFGKNSFGESNFSIKPLDVNSEPIHKLTTCVEGCFDINGNQIILRKEYFENWVKRRGSNEEVLDSHITKCSINNVPVGTMREYEEFIRENFAPEEVFRLISDPTHFPTRKMAEQRKILIELAGGIDPKLVFVGNNKMLDVYERIAMANKAENYAKMLSAKKAQIKAKLEEIPIKIKEVNNLTPKQQDWTALENELKGKQDILNTKRGQIVSVLERDKSELERKRAIQEQIAKLKQQIDTVKAAEQRELLKDYNEKMLTHDNNLAEITRTLNLINRHKERLGMIDADLIELNTKITALREQYREISSSVFVEDPNSLICPITKMEFCQEARFSAVEKLREAFNTDKATKEANNVKEGKALSQRISELSNEKANIEQQIQALNAPQTTDIKAPVKPDTSVISQETAQKIEEINKSIETLEKSLQTEQAESDKEAIDAIKEEISILEENVAELVSLLKDKDTIEKYQKRIKELGDEEQTLSQSLTDTEHEEDDFNHYTKVYLDVVNERTSHYFKFVKFKLFNKLMNGGLEETCEAMLNGVPYSDINAEGKVNSGLDIINAISKYYEVSAPIWIDNAESTNNFIPVNSQLVLLKVSYDKQLTINHN